DARSSSGCSSVHRRIRRLIPQPHPYARISPLSKRFSGQSKSGTFNSAITFENTSAAQRMARIWVSYHAKAWVAFLPDSLRCSVVSIGSAAPRHSRRNTYARRSVCQSLYMQRAKPRNAVSRAARIRVPARLGNLSRVRGPRHLRLQGVTPGIESSHGRRSHAALRRGAVLEGGPIRALVETPRQRTCRPGFLRHCLCELAGQSGPLHAVRQAHVSDNRGNGRIRTLTDSRACPGRTA